MAKKEIIQRGRTMGATSNSSFGKLLANDENSKTFTLKSGKTATFSRQVVYHGDIEKLTFVDSAVNGRDQSFLTEANLADILRTITMQQFYPAIGRMVEGRIEIMDGSRRRAACIIAGMPLVILVTQDELELSDARQLAVDIQTSKEHSLREQGKRFEIMYASGMNKIQIAEAEGISQAKVTRAFQAAAVPDEIISLFSNISDLTIDDYQALLKLTEEAEGKRVPIKELVDSVRTEIDSDVDAQFEKEKVMTKLRSKQKSLKTPPKRDGVVTEKLREYADVKQYARKRTDAKKRITTYEFSRLNLDVQKEIDEAIKAILAK